MLTLASKSIAVKAKKRTVEFIIVSFTTLEIAACSPA